MSTVCSFFFVFNLYNNILIENQILFPYITEKKEGKMRKQKGDAIILFVCLIAGILLMFGLYKMSKMEHYYFEKQEVEAIYYHGVNDFSVMYRDPENPEIIKTKKIKPQPLINNIPFEIITDVKEDEKNWYEVSIYTLGGEINKEKVGETFIRIHVKNVDDIESTNGISRL